MLSCILVGVSGGPVAEPEINYCIDLAQRHGAAITLVSVVDVERLRRVGSVPLGADHYAERMREARIRESHEHAERAIEQFATACAEKNVPVRVLRKEGDPIETLIAAWRYHDLCVLDAHRWFDSGIVPEPEDALLKLIAGGVRPLIAATEAARPVRNALIAYNGSLESAKAMKQFAQMRLWPDVALHIACVGGTKTQEPPQEVLEDAASYCRGQGYECTTEVLEGVPRDALPRHAVAIDADIIVLGSSFRKVLLFQRFGVNALSLLRSSPLPLFLSH
jgi:nucleotide-binding universal stress UspA family protein